VRAHPDGPGIRRTITLSVVVGVTLLAACWFWIRKAGRADSRSSQSRQGDGVARPSSSPLPAVAPSMEGHRGDRAAERPPEQAGSPQPAGSVHDATDTAYWNEVEQQVQKMEAAFDPSGCASWKEGYRAAQGLPFTSTLILTVVAPDGPLQNEPLQVEYVFAFLPPELRASGRYISAFKDDRDGTRWIQKFFATDETGAVRIDDLPYVQCKIIVAGKTVVAFPNGDLRIDVVPPEFPLKGK